MIWIYEYLTKNEIILLEKLNPYMDYSYDKKNKAHSWNTFCTRLEIVKGKIQDVRKARFFNLSETKQGLICDDIQEAKDLCAYMDDFPITELLLKYPKVKSYIDDKNTIWLKDIAVPVISYIKYFSENVPRLLDILDLELLKEYKLDFRPFIKREHFEGGKD